MPESGTESKMSQFQLNTISCPKCDNINPYGVTICMKCGAQIVAALPAPIVPLESPAPDPSTLPPVLESDPMPPAATLPPSPQPDPLPHVALVLPVPDPVPAPSILAVPQVPPPPSILPSPPSALPSPAAPTVAAVPSPVIRMPPQYVYPVKSRGLALALEILPWFFSWIGLGFLGIGWLYAGNVTTGILWLVGFFSWNIIAILLDVVSMGFFVCLHIPTNIALVIISAVNLNTYARKHPELFGA